jgi:hypothetical protein
MGRDPVADAINALADGDGDDDDDVSESEDEGDTPDVMAIVEAMAAHWESETHASIMAWSWPLFCTKWARLYEQLVAKRKYERKRDKRRQIDAEHRRDEQWFSQQVVTGDGSEE